MPHTSLSPGNRRLWLSAIVLAILALAVAIFPLWIIQPFKSQGPRILPVALAAFRFAPWITALCLLAISWIVIQSFRRRSQRVVASLCFVAIAASTLLAQTNVFEKMFNPAGEPVFVPFSALNLQDRDVLLSVTLHGQTHAYPLLSIAYHHVINDHLAGEPIVATY